MVYRLPLPELTASTRLITVLRGNHATQYFDVIEALISAGVRSMELTLTTPDTLASLSSLVHEFGSSADIGVGTVTTVGQAIRACRSGASYIVTPVTDPELIRISTDNGVAIVPGGLTPTELHSSWNHGASAVKVFPARVVGHAYTKDLRGPFPEMRVIPSGGVDLDGARAWLDAGADAVSVGGPILEDAFDGGDLGQLAARAKRFVEVCGAGGGA
ncbi:bifunctional 4-hydroxy-2-oxoglutarate aldolase/2-dehydro-3-deoxy-phosphogluconate aldolase [Allosalinactinospora lopnorensis]|uniref:bifunctional 4-hydroxy-2-oxoglutarate aldolase/2-dehydro-3-deoxy-phosphogluconate aldolase n=1 Tax=Allosalinactinospora lopnorensis TaxID=1352348 RepID=UPI000623FD8A|nr:bifunctional 4-hydroxy-2-oxoglutarate aldolase/2-dehydro-3-deoxy-phosphogluconate aldolase [Allosalinactinospora lopnorensis]